MTKAASSREGQWPGCTVLLDCSSVLLECSKVLLECFRVLLEARTLLGKAELGRDTWREYWDARRNCGKRPRRERLRLLKPYSSLALDGRENSRGSFLSCSWGLSGPPWAFLGLSGGFWLLLDLPGSPGKQGEPYQPPKHHR